MARRTTCPACGTRIIWAITEAGKMQALDWTPDPGGNQAAEQDVHGTWRARYAPPGEELIFPLKRFMPHAASSPACFRRDQKAALPDALPDGVTGLDAWKKARTAQARARRNRRGRRPSRQAAAIEQPGMFRRPPPGGTPG